MDKGWIKLHRSILDDPVICKDSDHLAVWNYLLLKATYNNGREFFKGKQIELKPGQLITGRKKIAEKLGCHESKIQRVLKLLENEQRIEQQTSNKKRLITIKNWQTYQQSEQQNEPQLNNNRTTTEQQLNTSKKVRKEESKKREEDIYTRANTFEKSNLSDQKTFKETFKEQENQGIDLNYYYHAVNDWCNNLPDSDKRKFKDFKGWVATVNNFMRRDLKEGKLKKVENEQTFKNFLNL